MWRELQRVFTALAADQHLRCIVVQGAGEHFAAGADIAEFPSFRFNEASLREYHEDIIAPALEAIWQCDIPIIAAVRGNCVGGGLEIAACCDFRLARADACFGAPIAKLGFPMAPQELHAVVRAFGFANVRELLLSAELWSAPKALAKGLVSSVNNAIELEAQIDYSCSAAAKLPTESLRNNKRNLRALAQASFPRVGGTFDYAALAHSKDHHEGIQAFLDKRPPQF